MKHLIKDSFSILMFSMSGKELAKQIEKGLVNVFDLSSNLGF